MSFHLEQGQIERPDRISSCHLEHLGRSALQDLAPSIRQRACWTPRRHRLGSMHFSRVPLALCFQTLRLRLYIHGRLRKTRSESRSRGWVGGGEGVPQHIQEIRGSPAEGRREQAAWISLWQPHARLRLWMEAESWTGRDAKESRRGSTQRVRARAVFPVQKQAVVLQSHC